MLYIGSRIQEYRKKAELSQEEFADKIGVSRQAVSKWERDKAYPDLDRLVCICEILDVQMDELIYGEERKKQGELTQENLASNNIVHMKNLRGRNRFMRLKVIFGIMTVICIFSIVMMAVLFVRNEWSNHKDKNDNVRVEKVYQQYTKADLCYFDDDGRKIMNTVWLDVPGIRDGDYIQCYTGNDNSGLFLNYSLSTLIFVAVFVIVMIILLILTGSEFIFSKSYSAAMPIRRNVSRFFGIAPLHHLSTDTRLTRHRFANADFVSPLSARISCIFCIHSSCCDCSNGKIRAFSSSRSSHLPISSLINLVS